MGRVNWYLRIEVAEIQVIMKVILLKEFPQDLVFMLPIHTRGNNNYMNLKKYIYKFL